MSLNMSISSPDFAPGSASGVNNSPEQTGREAAPADNGATISEREARIRDYLKTTQDDPFYTGDLTYLLVVLDAERLRIVQLKTQLQELIASVKGLPTRKPMAQESKTDAQTETPQAGSASGVNVTIVEHPKCFLMRLEHDGKSMTLDRAEAFDLYEKLSAKLGGMPVAGVL